MNSGTAVCRVVSATILVLQLMRFLCFGYSVSQFMFGKPCAGFIGLPEGGAKGVFKGSSAHLRGGIRLRGVWVPVAAVIPVNILSLRPVVNIPATLLCHLEVFFSDFWCK